MTHIDTGPVTDTITIADTDFFAGLPSPARTRYDALDVYVSDGPARRRPAVLFVHGGPVPADKAPTPRDSAVFIGYGALAAAHGLAGITFDHRLRLTEETPRPEEAVIVGYPRAADDVVAAVEQARGLDRVDPDRIAIWFFSGGGGLAAEWVRSAPPWLRAVAWTYPALCPPPDWPGDVERFDCVSAARDAPALPKLMVRVGAEYPQLVTTQQALVDTARTVGSALEVVELPWSPHGYEVHGQQPDARAATERAMAWVADALGDPAGVRLD